MFRRQLLPAPMFHRWRTSADAVAGRDRHIESARFRQIGRSNCPDLYLEMTFRSCSLRSLKQGQAISTLTMSGGHSCPTVFRSAGMSTLPAKKSSVATVLQFRDLLCRDSGSSVASQRSTDEYQPCLWGECVITRFWAGFRPRRRVSLTLSKKIHRRRCLLADTIAVAVAWVAAGS